MTKNGDIFLLMTTWHSFQSKGHRIMQRLYGGWQFWQITKKKFVFFSIVDTPCQRVVWRIYDKKPKKYFFFSIESTDTLRQLLTLLTKCKKICHVFCHAQVTFRQLLTMLAIFDLSFIVCAFISFSLPQLSPHWKVSRIRIALMKIFGQFWGDYETINLGIFDLIFVTISFCCHSLN